LFVALAEEGLITGPIVEAIAHRYLDDIFAIPETQQPDTLVLGCTHFPVLIDSLRKVVGDRVVIVDSALTAAVALEQELARTGLRRSGMPSKAAWLRLLATDGRERFARVGGIFLGEALSADDVELVDLGV
jgi:glutamate racemase